jgi:hypothetical protein
MLSGLRTLDLRRGLLISELSYRTRAGIAITGNELRLVSQADRAVGLQLLRFSLDRDDIDIRLEASFGMAGLGMEPLRLEPDIIVAACNEAWHFLIGDPDRFIFKQLGAPATAAQLFSCANSMTNNCGGNMRRIGALSPIA